MKRGLIAVGGVALVAALALVVALNPGEVEFHPTHLHSFRPMLGVLLILTFLLGGVVVLLGGSLRQLSSMIVSWRQRRGARAAAQAGAWHEAGEAAAWSGELERSRALLRKAWRRQAGNSAAALALASSYMDTGEYGAAHEVLSAALEEDANDPDLRYALGEALRRRGDSSEAIRMLESVRVRFPRAPRVLISLRELYRDSERWREAADVQAAYLESFTGAAGAGERQRLIELRYQAAQALPDPHERLTALDAVVRSDRDFLPAIVSLGDALVEVGRVDEARKVWEKGFRNHPRLVLVERLLAHASSPREQERTVALLGRGDLSGDGARLVKVHASLRQGQLERAERELQAIGRQDAPSVQRAWAELHHQRGDHAAAWSAVTRAADALGTAEADHRCTSCGRFSEAWTGYCAGCGRWDTYRAAVEG
ncbi:MAG: tetratricopeptide repeat protein [Deltaproteobacteria bacterium]|nr:tetratricopeptide repeat protein [Deltaproteobacteria bacterium]